MLGLLDYIVLGSYLLIVAAVGLWASRRQHSTRDFFLGSKNIPWWAAGVSILATETSALTFIGAPTQSLRGDWTYLQLAIGSSLARFLVAGVLIGAYYRAEVFTVYGYLAQRFGPWSRNLAAGLFFVGRSLGSGVRLYGAAIALVVVANLDFPLAIALIAAVAVSYTLLGGLRSVIWTDLVQAILLVGGAVIALVFLVRQSDLGFFGLFSEVAATVSPTGHSKLRVIDLSLDPRQAYTLAAGLIGSTFLTFSTHGTDQDMIQRSLACREAKGGRRSLFLSAALAVPVALLFLMIGSALWLNLGGDQGALRLATEIAAEKGLANPEKGFDFLFPFYIVQLLPPGVKGLIVAAIFATSMSSLDSAVAALSSTAVKCVWEPYLAPGRTEAYYLRIARGMAVFFGLVLTAVATVVWLSEGAGGAQQGFGILMLGLKVLSWIFPPLLGIFLVGVLTRRGRDGGNVLAIALGIGTLLLVEWWTPIFGGPAPFAWTWNALVGCAVSFAVAFSFRPQEGVRLRE